MELTDGIKEDIKQMPYEEMLRLCRFAPVGSEYFQGEIGDFFMQVMDEKRNADPAGHIRASKALGWGEVVG